MNRMTNTAVTAKTPAAAPTIDFDDTADDERNAIDALTLGRRIRALRLARHLTLDALGAAIERAPSQVSMIENGKRSRPRCL
jgi:hypothetical protein